MKRNEHLFQFSGKQISAAATAEYEYHLGRMRWWQAEHDKALEKAKAAGFEVREYQISGGGKRAQLVVDPTVDSRLSECGGKVAEHQKKADQFQIEAATYGTQPERAYELQPDDVLYFRLAGGPRVE